VLTLYDTPLDYRGYLVVAVSQSGRTPEIVRVLEQARASGAACVAITNDGEAPLARAAHAVLDLRLGTERAVPATKTVTGQLVAFALLAEALGEVSWSRPQLAELPEAIAALLADPDPAEAAAATLRGADRMLTVARGVLYGAACEAALKITETTSMFATGFSAADLRHGPIAAVTRDMPVLAMTARGPAAEDMRALLAELRERGTAPVVLGNTSGVDLAFPEWLPEALTPVAAVVRAQQIALALARHLGVDPDAPPGLAKVTAT
jgi:glucosamine--fructose-6-phosphate aminotransferase (isomerizing)